MGLLTGETIEQGDFLTEATKNATPSNDAGKSIKQEADGRLGTFFTRNGQILTAGETINGGTLPVPVYQNSTDNELYACDANDNTKYKFIGFAISNSTNGNPIKFQGSGIVTGFSGLDEGKPYYVQDTAGTIGTTPGTHGILVGIAISTTDLLIQKGTRYASGYGTFSAAGSNAITLGFRPRKIKVFAWQQGEVDVFSFGTWCDGVYTCSGQGDQTGDNPGAVISSTSAIWRVDTDINDGDAFVGTISSVTDTGFTFTNVEDNSAPAMGYFWEAEGEL